MKSGKNSLIYQLEQTPDTLATQFEKFLINKLRTNHLQKEAEFPNCLYLNGYILYHSNQ